MKVIEKVLSVLFPVRLPVCSGRVFCGHENNANEEYNRLKHTLELYRFEVEWQRQFND